MNSLLNKIKQLILSHYCLLNCIIFFAFFESESGIETDRPSQIHSGTFCAVLLPQMLT